MFSRKQMGKERSFPLKKSNRLWLEICKPSAMTVLGMEENYTKGKLPEPTHQQFANDTSAKKDLVWCL